MKALIEDLWLFVIRRIMTLSSFCGVIVFFLLVKHDLPFLLQLPPPLRHYWLGAIILCAAAIVLCYLSLRLARAAIKSNDTLDATEVKPIENIAMPTYIGLFVIALEISDNKLEESATILTILFILWWLFERVFYFNPLWLFFGYRFYEVKTRGNNTLTLITKRKDLKGEHLFDGLRRINAYTYLESDNG